MFVAGIPVIAPEFTWYEISHAKTTANWTVMDRGVEPVGCVGLRESCAEKPCCQYQGAGIVCTGKSKVCCAFRNVGCEYDQDCCFGLCTRRAPISGAYTTAKNNSGL